MRNLSITLYCIYVCYTNITLYIAFGIIRVTAVGLGTYYPVDTGKLLYYDCFGHSSSFVLAFDDIFSSDVYQGM
jgi:hypothetical protein